MSEADSLDDLQDLDDADRADIALCESILARGDEWVPHAEVMKALGDDDVIE